VKVAVAVKVYLIQHTRAAAAVCRPRVQTRMLRGVWACRHPSSAMLAASAPTCFAWSELAFPWSARLYTPCGPTGGISAPRRACAGAGTRAAAERRLGRPLAVHPQIPAAPTQGAAEWCLEDGGDAEEGESEVEVPAVDARAPDTGAVSGDVSFLRRNSRGQRRPSKPGNLGVVPRVGRSAGACARRRGALCSGDGRGSKRTWGKCGGRW